MRRWGAESLLPHLLPRNCLLATGERGRERRLSTNVVWCGLDVGLQRQDGQRTGGGVWGRR